MAHEPRDTPSVSFCASAVIDDSRWPPVTLPKLGFTRTPKRAAVYRTKTALYFRSATSVS